MSKKITPKKRIENTLNIINKKIMINESSMAWLARDVYCGFITKDYFDEHMEELINESAFLKEIKDTLEE